MDPKEYRSENAGKAVFTQTGYWAFIPNPLPPDIPWSASLVSVLSEAERELSRLSTLASAFPFPRLLIQPFMRNEAVISSRIEGTHASLIDVYAYETAQLSFFERTEDVREVYNAVRAMEYGLERLNTLPISLRLIRELHEKLMEGVRGGTQTPGEFRRSQNWIGPVGSTPSSAPYVPPPVEEMHHSLDALEKFIHSDTDIPPLIRAGMIHYQFEAIHPISRRQWPGWPSPDCALALRMEIVVTALTQFEYLYRTLSARILRSSAWRFSTRRLGSVVTLLFAGHPRTVARECLIEWNGCRKFEGSINPFVEQDRNSLRMAAVIDFLFSRPVLSVRQAADGLGIPFKTAQAFLLKLVQAGVLREITGYARNRIFQADEILRAVQGNDVHST